MNDLQQVRKTIRFKLNAMTLDANRRHRRGLKQQLGV